MLLSCIGVVEEKDGKPFVSVRKGEIGYALYGPYVHLTRGLYEVEFEIHPTSRVLRDTGACIVDVFSNKAANKPVAARLGVSSLIAAGGVASLCFRVEEDATFEFRVHTTGKVALRIRAERRVRMIEGDLSPFTDAPEAVTNQLLLSHVAELRDLQSLGMSIAVDDDRVIARRDGIAFEMAVAEDFQLTREVFFSSEYTIHTPRDVLVADIGMNMGLTSLFLAKNPRVREIHAFEPFAGPYRRALRNFAMNPWQEGKIHPFNVGLGARDETVAVMADAQHTIGTSIRGAATGQIETIAIRCASDVLKPLAQRARADGLGFVVKMDCEGSEFPIFEVLVRDGVLPLVDAMMIEWHKWWSPDLTQQHLIEPLIAYGYTVFDRTNPTDPYAGFLYAVRSTAA